MRNIKGVLGIAVTLGLSVTAFAPATERHVPSEYATIQAAIDACVDGDEVVVADGVYTGAGNRDIRFFGKAITVRSENGSTACVIDCGNLGRGFYLHDNETNASVVDGFTIQHGYGNEGGGVACLYGGTIRNCVLRENYAGHGGGAFLSAVNGHAPILENCTIVSNVATVSGGGAYLQSGEPEVPILIRNCTISNNTAISGALDRGYGGGLYLYHNYCSIEHCVLSGNTANWGGGISGTLRTAANCVFTSNTAVYGGGALSASGAAYQYGGTLRNCLLTENSAGYYGGSLYADGSSFELRGCTVAHNVSMWYGGGVYGCGATSYSSAFGSIVAENAAAYGTEVALDDHAVFSTEYTDIPAENDWLWVANGSIIIWGPGSINVDPMFADAPNGDFHLSAGSPCIGSGNRYWFGPGEFDMDGEPRVMGGRMDMGADEFTDEPFVFGDVNCDGAHNFADINPFVLALIDAAAYQSAYPDCFLRSADCNGSGEVGFDDINPFVLLLTGG